MDALLTLDGRQLTGMIAAETATSVTLKRADNASDTVLRIDIDQLKSTGLSLMPEGLEKDLAPQDLADVIAVVRVNDLAEHFAEQLHPCVREKYAELWRMPRGPHRAPGREPLV